MPPRTRIDDVGLLIRELDGLCSASQRVDREIAEEQNRTMAAVQEFPVLHRVLKRQSDDPCVVAHAIAEQLAVELARERAESFALEAEIELTRVHDIIHSTVYDLWCIDEPNLPHSPNACIDRLWAREFFKFVTIHWALAIIIVVAVFRAVFRYEHVVNHRLCTTIFITHGLRTTCFLCTGMPMINMRCRIDYTGRVTNGGGCGDYLFSGHAIIMIVCLLVLFHQRAISSPRWPLWFLVPLSVLFFGCVVGYAVEKWHYTVDILLACYFTPAVWAWTWQLYGPEVVGSKRTWWMPYPAIPSLGVPGGYRQLGHLTVFAIIIGGTIGFGAVGVSVSAAVQLDEVFGALMGLLLSAGGLCAMASEVTHIPGELRTPDFGHPALLCTCCCQGDEDEDGKGYFVVASPVPPVPAELAALADVGDKSD